MRHLKLITLICFIFFPAQFLDANESSVGDKLDSLINQIDNASNYEHKLDLYLELIEYFQYSNLNKSLTYCDTAIELAQKNNNRDYTLRLKLFKARSLIFKGNMDEASLLLHQIELELVNLNDNLLWGQYYLVRNLAYGTVSDYTNAMENGLRAISYLEKASDSLSLAKAYNNIGVIYELTENRQMALEYYLKAMEISQQSGHDEIIGELYNNIGIIYYTLGDNNRALEYYYKSLENSNRRKEELSMALSFSNIALVLLDLERFDEARSNFLNAFQIYNKHENKPGLAMIFDNLGNYFVAIQKYDSAQRYYTKCYNLYQELADNYSAHICLEELGDMYLLQNKYTQALPAFKEVFHYAKTSRHSDLKEKSALSLSKTYAQLKDYKTAYFYQSIVVQISDSLTRINKAEDVKHSELQIEFKKQTRKYERDLERFESDTEKAHKRKVRERFIFIFMFFLTLSVGFILFRNYRSSIRLNSKLVKKNREVEEQKELIEISNIELKEQYTFTETLLNTIPNPVYYTDKNSNILGCNKAFEEITGRITEELVGYNISELNVRTMLSCDTSKLFGNPGKNLVQNEGTIVYKDKREHDVIVYRRGIVSMESKVIGILGIIIDITDFKKAERDLRQSQIKLKDAIATKDKFFNIIAHDLKNPFNAIIGLTSLISDQFEEHNKEDLQQYVKLINQSANQIYNLLENLLEWARTQSGSIEFLPVTFPISEVITESIDVFSNSIEQKRLNIQFQESGYLVYGDQNMTKSVFRNLLSNAIKYSFDEGIIEIIMEANEEQLSIHIQDFGQGIKADNLENIFKIEKPTSTPGVNNERGTGLGLVISQEFVKLNGGNMHVQSELGKGSRFTFTIPLVM